MSKSGGTPQEQQDAANKRFVADAINLRSNRGKLGHPRNLIKRYVFVFKITESSAWQCAVQGCMQSTCSLARFDRLCHWRSKLQWQSKTRTLCQTRHQFARHVAAFACMRKVVVCRFLHLCATASSKCDKDVLQQEVDAFINEELAHLQLSLECKELETRVAAKSMQHLEQQQADLQGQIQVRSMQAVKVPEMHM